MRQGGSGLVIYGDFSCVRCYVASQRLDVLTHGGVELEWRAIEHHRDLPVAGRHRDEQAMVAIGQDLVALGEGSPSGIVLPERAPALVPKTKAAVSAYAEACGAHVADEIRRLLFTSYWQHGTDIGNPEVLRSLLDTTFMMGDSTSAPIREFGYAVAMTREPITGGAWRRIREWRRQWLDLDVDALPVVTDGSRVESGDAALEWLDGLVPDSPANANGGADDHAPAPAWRPPTTVLPPETWTTQVGNPWNRTARMRRQASAR